MKIPLPTKSVTINTSEDDQEASVGFERASAAKASKANCKPIPHVVRSKPVPMVAKKIGQVKGSATDSKQFNTVVIDQVLVMRLLTERRVSKIMDTPMGTLRRWRCVGGGPLYIKLGDGPKAPVRYDPIDIYVYVEAGRRFASIRAGITEDTKHGS
jgi:hypothetical protein